MSQTDGGGAHGHGARAESAAESTFGIPTEMPLLPRPLTSFGAAWCQGSLYVYGGHHGAAHHYHRDGQTGDLLRLDESAWRVVESGPPLQGLALIGHQEQLLRIGGLSVRNAPDAEQDLWSVAELAAWSPGHGWRALPPLPQARSSFGAALVGETLYIVGGWQLRGDRQAQWPGTILSASAADLLRAEGTTSGVEWRERAAPFRRRALGVAGLGRRLFAIGGMCEDGEVTSRTDIFDPDTGEWSRGPDLPGGEMAGFGAACCTRQDSLYVSTSTGELWRLDTANSTYEPAGRLSAGRFFHALLPWDATHLVAIGGASMQRGKFATLEVVKVE